jgi:prophage regulatory protein
MLPPRLLRFPQVLEVSGLRGTSLYADIKDGLFPPPVRLSGRGRAWPELEVFAINRARIAGKSNEQIKALVTDMVAARVRLGV